MEEENRKVKDSKKDGKDSLEVYSALALRRWYSHIHADVDPRLQDPKYVFTCVCPHAKVIREGLKCASKLFGGPVPVIITPQNIQFVGSTPLVKDAEEGALVSASIMTAKSMFVNYNYRSPKPYLKFTFGSDIVKKHTSDGQNQLVLWFLQLDPVCLWIQPWGNGSDHYDEIPCYPIEADIPLWIGEKTTFAEDCRALQITFSTFLNKSYGATFRNAVEPMQLEIHNNCIYLIQKQVRRRIGINAQTEDGDPIPPLTKPLVINTCTFAFYHVFTAVSHYNKTALMMLDPKKPNRIILVSSIQEFAAGARVCLDVNRPLVMMDSGGQLGNQLANQLANQLGTSNETAVTEKTQTDTI